jgi:protein-S-isoprenylcysteine O-methyltransferase Ste14
MSSATEMLAVAMVVVVAAGWIVFTAAFVLREKGPRSEEHKRDRASIAGVIMQMAGYALVFSIRRPSISAIGGDSIGMAIAAIAITVTLVVGSVWMVTRAVHVLGKQGLAIFLMGTAVRVRIEERLLRGEFGEEYDAYAKQVPSILPLMR